MTVFVLLETAVIAVLSVSALLVTRRLYREIAFLNERAEGDPIDLVVHTDEGGASIWVTRRDGVEWRWRCEMGCTLHFFRSQDGSGRTAEQMAEWNEDIGEKPEVGGGR